MKEGSEIYSEFTLSRIKKALHSEPLSDRQVTLLRQILNEGSQLGSHSVDLRLSIPLGYASFYLCLFAGRDRRLSSLKLYGLRWSRSVSTVRRYLLLTGIASLSCVVALVLFVGLYKVKQAIGVDIFPDFHLKDLIPWI